MKRFRESLTARIFVAISATTVLVIAIMALLVAVAMRDGFARYLLRGELARFDELEQALVLAYDPAAPEWPQFATHPQAWNDFVRTHFAPPGRAAFSPPQGPPPKRLDGTRPIGPPPGSGGAGMPGDSLMLNKRLALLAPDGSHLAGSIERSGMLERRKICLDNDCKHGLLGYIALNAPLDLGDASGRFFLRGQYWALAIAALVAVLFSAVTAYIVARRMLVPIRHLEAAAKAMASGDYTARIAQTRRDELGQLVGHYNALAAALERTDKAEREWISNTSHELQTPLAVLRAQIEALQDGVRLPDAVTLDAMHAAMMRLSRLVQDIKTLSHAREDALALLFRSEDLCAIVREAAEAARPQFEANGIALELDLPDHVQIWCDRARIGQVIDNLLANSARYTHAPGRVRLQVRGENGYAILVLDDTPPGPPDADMPRLFDRFYRAESSRSRVHGGSGLGLSVCRAIVDTHNGTINAEPSDLGGLRITLRLPKGTT
ncbi:ATP-binding protein [Roseovarius sp. Pro17]|uniref:ATP-binding protein n=1 Tax=Roseovarius sp. Pro17 TaxID=3108175 RepID=UPI002D79CB70|nr:ATP-binding protein [Roseovarius sp. Pro17]